MDPKSSLSNRLVILINWWSYHKKNILLQDKPPFNYYFFSQIKVFPKNSDYLYMKYLVYNENPN